jgi:hypothetical protein
MRVKGENPTLSLITGSPLFCQFEYRLRDASCQESDQLPHLQGSRSFSINTLVPTRCVAETTNQGSNNR